MNSFNHYSLGSVGEWLFRHVAGIELDPEFPGFQKFVLRPFLPTECAPDAKRSAEHCSAGTSEQEPAEQCTALHFARASYRTMHGEISSEWKQVGGQLTWNIRIPANTTAKVFVPSDPDATVTEGGKPVAQAAGLRVLGTDNDFLICEAVSGVYSFHSNLK
jgi:alpha-L-rhamnosidase